LLSVLLLFVVSAASTFGVPPTDHPSVTPYQGSKLLGRTDSKFDSVSFPIEPTSAAKYAGKTLAVEGKVTRLVYLNPADRSALEVFRNYQTALQKDGFPVAYLADNAKTIGFGHKLAITLGLEGPNTCRAPGNDKTFFEIAKRSGQSGDSYIAVFTAACQNNAAAPVGKSVIWIIEGKAMDTGMAAVKAKDMARAIEQNGAVSLYGIHFDFDKAEIRPESAPMLEEIGKLLKAESKLSMFVVGHTDLEGKLDYNMNLSQKRALAVVKWLEKNAGIAAARLAAHGVGSLSPKSTNRTEAGRALNRRVELVAR